MKMAKISDKQAKTLAIILIGIVVLALLGFVVWFCVGHFGHRSATDAEPGLATARTSILDLFHRKNQDVAAPAADSTPQAAVPTQPVQTVITEVGTVTTQFGTLVKYHHSGGYNPARDPYSANFDQKSTANSFGVQISGSTFLEQVQNMVIAMMDSPEAILTWRSLMDLETYNGLAAENTDANLLRNLSAEQYDAIANNTADAWYSRIEGGSYEQSPGYTLKRVMIDEIQGDHSNAKLKGMTNSDNDDENPLYTFKTKSGQYIFASEQAFLNTWHDAGDPSGDFSRTAWTDFIQGNTWKWKSGTPGSSGSPGSPQSEPPGPSGPTKDESKIVTPERDPQGAGQADTTLTDPQTQNPPADPGPPITAGTPTDPTTMVGPEAQTGPAEDCNGNGSTSDEQAGAVREDHTPVSTVGTSPGSNNDQAVTGDGIAQASDNPAMP